MVENIIMTGFLIYLIYYSINCYFYYYPSKGETLQKKMEEPLLSVLIPARNEEKNIKNAVDSVLNNCELYLECIVLNDNSTDKTMEILSEYSDKRLRIISGKPLPKGWIGKNWACHQLAQNAQGQIILFSDADTIHTKHGLNLLVKKMNYTNADLLSGIPKQIIKSFGEALTVPFLGLFSLGALPHFLFRLKQIKWAAASNGQYQCFKKKSYEEMGGYTAIYNILADDIAFPRRFKAQKKKVVYTNISNLVSSRMYDGFKDAFKGFSKSFYPTINESPILAAIVCLAIFLMFLSPYCLLFFSFSLKALLSLIFSLTVWCFACLNIRVHALIIFLHPIVPFILIAMLINSVFSYHHQGYLWKGRRYSEEWRS